MDSMEPWFFPIRVALQDFSGAPFCTWRHLRSSAAAPGPGGSHGSLPWWRRAWAGSGWKYRRLRPDPSCKGRSGPVSPGQICGQRWTMDRCIEKESTLGYRKVSPPCRCHAMRIGNCEHTHRPEWLYLNRSWIRSRKRHSSLLGSFYGSQ